MNQKTLAGIAIALLALSAAAIGYRLWANRADPLPLSSNVAAPPPSASQPGTNTVQPNDISPGQTPAGIPGWKTHTDQQLAIRFEYPPDAIVSPVAQRQTADGAAIDELIVTPSGMDPTRVHFFSTAAPLDKAKNIQIYPSEIKSSEFSDVAIDGYVGIRRIDHYSANECTNELTVVGKGGSVYGFHITQCPTHTPGYDQLRRDIANSLELL